MAYDLFLTEEDISTIEFVGDRYCWSSALLEHAEAGGNSIMEHIAWEIRQAIEDDLYGDFN